MTRTMRRKLDALESRAKRIRSVSGFRRIVREVAELGADELLKPIRRQRGVESLRRVLVALIGHAAIRSMRVENP